MKDFSTTGLLTVEFNETILQSAKPGVDWIDSSILELSVRPSQINANLSNFNFTWETVSFEDNFLEIQVTFNSSAQISNDIV